MIDNKEPTREDQVQLLHDQNMQNAWAVFLASENGRMVLWSVLEQCHIFQTTYTGNQLQAFMEGERNIGLKILAERVFPQGMEIFAQMLLESEKRDKAIQAAIDETLKEQEENML